MALGQFLIIFRAGLAVEAVVLRIFVAQIAEIAVFPVGQFRADADDDGLTDVGAHIRDAHHVGEEVFEVGVEKDVALAPAHSGKVILFQGADQVRGDLAEGLDAVGGPEISLFKGQLCLREDLFQEGLEDIQLFHGGVGEGGILFRKPPGIVGDVDGVVSQTLELRDDLIVLVDDGDVEVVLEMGKELYQIAADPLDQTGRYCSLRPGSSARPSHHSFL